MTRRNQILLGVLVIQLVLAGIVFWPRQPATATGQPLFADIAATEINSLTLTSSQGDTIRLAKVDGNWVLPDADNYAVETDKVTALLDKLADLTPTRLVTQTDASHKRLKVAANDYNAQVAFETTDGSQYQLYVGSMAGYGATHVRANSDETVYLVNNLSPSDASARAAAWIDTSYFSVNRDEVVAIQLENANGRLEFAKDPTGTWMMAGLTAAETLDQSKVTSLLSSVSSITMREPLGQTERPEYGLQSPTATLTLTTRSDTDGEATYTLRVGAQIGDDQSYALKASTSDYYVSVYSYVITNWFDKGRADFIQAPPTATP